MRSWVKERAAKFVTNYSNLDNNCSQDPSRILETLTKAIATLQSAVRSFIFKQESQLIYTYHTY